MKKALRVYRVMRKVNEINRLEFIDLSDTCFVWLVRSGVLFAVAKD